MTIKTPIRTPTQPPALKPNPISIPNPQPQSQPPTPPPTSTLHPPSIGTYYLIFYQFTKKNKNNCISFL